MPKWSVGKWPVSVSLEGRKSSGTIQIFWVALLTILAIAALLSRVEVRIGGLSFSSLDIRWILGSGIALLVLAVPRSPATRRPLVYLLAGLALAASGGPLLRWWENNRIPASPLSVRVGRLSDRPGSLGSPLSVGSVAGTDPLQLNGRRDLVRLTGYRRNVTLDIRGFLFAPSPGNYRFDLRCDDSCELSIEGRRVAGVRGSARVSLPLEAGAHSFRLRYRQGAGPASLTMDWDRPELVELLPLPAFVAGDVGALERARIRSERHAAWWVLGLSMVWTSVLAWVLVRVAESRMVWGRHLFERLRDWWRRPPSAAPVALIRPFAWLSAGSVLLGLWAFCAWQTPMWLESARRQYAVNPVRRPFVLERIEAFPSYLLFLALLCAAVAAALWLARPRSGSPSSPPRLLRRAPLGLLVAIGVALAWGVWVSQSEWVRYGRPCYDGYCDYAELVRQVFVRPGPSTWELLRHHLGVNYHANSPVGPILIASLGLVIPDIVDAYRLLSAVATLMTLFLLLRIARRYLGLSSTSAWIGAFLFAASGSVARSGLFPQTDALAMCFFTLAVERLLALRENFTLPRYLAATTCTTVALFTKLSTLPLLGVAALVLLWPLPQSSLAESTLSTAAVAGSRSPLLTRLLSQGLRTAAVVTPPLVLVGLFVLALRTSDNYRTELHRIGTLDSRASFHIVATFVTLLPLLLALLVTWRRAWTRLEILLLAIIGVYLLGLWGSGASGWERFYLNVMPIALPLSVKRLEPLPELNAPAVVAVLFSAYFAAHAVRIALHLYNGA